MTEFLPCRPLFLQNRLDGRSAKAVAENRSAFLAEQPVQHDVPQFHRIMRRIDVPPHQLVPFGIRGNRLGRVHAAAAEIPQLDMGIPAPRIGLIDDPRHIPFPLLEFTAQAYAVERFQQSRMDGGNDYIKLDFFSNRQFDRFTKLVQHIQAGWGSVGKGPVRTGRPASGSEFSLYFRELLIESTILNDFHPFTVRQHPAVLRKIVVHGVLLPQSFDTGKKRTAGTQRQHVLPDPMPWIPMAVLIRKEMALIAKPFKGVDIKHLNFRTWLTGYNHAIFND